MILLLIYKNGLPVPGSEANLRMRGRIALLALVALLIGYEPSGLLVFIEFIFWGIPIAYTFIDLRRVSASRLRLDSFLNAYGSQNSIRIDLRNIVWNQFCVGEKDVKILANILHSRHNIPEEKTLALGERLWNRLGKGHVERRQLIFFGDYKREYKIAMEKTVPYAICADCQIDQRKYAAAVSIYNANNQLRGNPYIDLDVRRIELAHVIAGVLSHGFDLCMIEDFEDPKQFYDRVRQKPYHCFRASKPSLKDIGEGLKKCKILNIPMDYDAVYECLVVLHATQEKDHWDILVATDGVLERGVVW